MLASAATTASFEQRCWAVGRPLLADFSLRLGVRRDSLVMRDRVEAVEPSSCDPLVKRCLRYAPGKRVLSDVSGERSFSSSTRARLSLPRGVARACGPVCTSSAAEAVARSRPGDAMFRSRRRSPRAECGLRATPGSQPR